MPNQVYGPIPTVSTIDVGNGPISALKVAGDKSADRYAFIHYGGSPYPVERYPYPFGDDYEGPKVVQASYMFEHSVSFCRISQTPNKYVSVLFLHAFVFLISLMNYVHAITHSHSIYWENWGTVRMQRWCSNCQWDKGTLTLLWLHSAMFRLSMVLLGTHQSITA